MFNLQRVLDTFLNLISVKGLHLHFVVDAGVVKLNGVWYACKCILICLIYLKMEVDRCSFLDLRLDFQITAKLFAYVFADAEADPNSSSI